MDENRPTPLDYATPQAHRARPVTGTLAALLGMVAGLFGALMLLCGISGLVYVGSPHRDSAEDLFEVMMFMLIGAVCLFIAVRWCRAAARLFTGK